MLTINDWNHIQAMEQCMLLPARICSYLSGSKYPALSIASLAFNGLLTHCNKHLVMDMESSSSMATLQVQEKASEKCLQYLIKYQESLKFISSQITTFLDSWYVTMLIVFSYIIHLRLLFFSHI